MKKLFIIFALLYIVVNSYTQESYIKDINARPTGEETVSTINKELGGVGWQTGGGALTSDQINDSLKNRSQTDVQTLSFTKNVIGNKDTTDIIIGTGNVVDAPFNDKVIGTNNIVTTDSVIGRYGNYQSVIGKDNYSNSNYSSISGVACWNDGIIVNTTGNSNITSGNDSYTGGNQCTGGRRQYPVYMIGEDNLNVTGITLPYVIVDDTLFKDINPYPVGNIKYFFPDSVTYAATGGDFYDGQSYPSFLSFAMHSFLMVRGGGETERDKYRIIDVQYQSDIGTKIWYNAPTTPFDTIRFVMSSTAPTIRGGGNSHTTFGLGSSTYGYGAMTAGMQARAWGNGVFTSGQNCIVDTSWSGGGGYFAYNRGMYSFIWSDRGVIHKGANWSVNFGFKGHNYGKYTGAFNKYSNAFGDASNSFNDSTTALGESSNAYNIKTVAEGEGSNSYGNESYAKRDYQQAYSAGKFTYLGDNQTSKVCTSRTFSDAGWWAFELITFDSNKTYYGEFRLVGVRTDAGTADQRESTVYKYRYMVETGNEYSIVPSTINTLTNYIYVGDDISDNTTVIFNRPTGSTLPSPLNNFNLYYVVNTKTDSIQVSTSQGGVAVDLTTVGSGDNSMLIFNLVEYDTDADALYARSFNDGGDGIATGVRTNIQTNYFSNKRLVIRIDQIAGYTIRWTAFHQFEEVGSQ